MGFNLHRPPSCTITCLPCVRCLGLVWLCEVPGSWSAREQEAGLEDDPSELLSVAAESCLGYSFVTVSTPWRGGSLGD